MIEVLNRVIGVSTMSFAQLYMWKHLGKNKMKYFDKRLITVFVLLSGLLLFNYFCVEKFLRILLLSFSFMLFYKILFRSNMKEAIIVPLISQMIVMISETLLVLIVVLLFGGEAEFISNHLFGSILANAWISLFAIFLSDFKIATKFTQNILKYTSKIKEEIIVLITFMVLVVANVLAMNAYYLIDFKYYLVFNTVITIIYLFLVLNSLKNKNEYMEVYDKYNITLSSLKEYEDVLNNYRVSNHENKNQLLTIRNMIKGKEKKILEYIDQIIENKQKDNDELLWSSMVIPEGGLRGLIYSKMLVMKEKEIEFSLNIDKSIRSCHLIELGEKTLLDVCRIMGVFLDNSIEAVQNLKEKMIDFEMSIEDNRISISVTNNFEGTIDLDHMDEIGFSTKGKSHGYGLCLVKQLVEKNSVLKHERKIKSNVFTQTLVINMRF